MKKLKSVVPGLIAGVVVLASLTGAGGSQPCKDPSAINAIGSDAEMLFFPTFAVSGKKSGTWDVFVHAWVYEPEKNSVKRKMLIDVAKKDLGLKDGESNSKNFETMAGYLLVDQEGGEDVVVTLGGTGYCVGRTDKNGHAESVISVEEKAAGSSLVRKGGVRYITFYAETSSLPKRRFTGKARIIENRGIMVVSDIDDTIRISNVRDRNMLIENTFYRPFVPVPGMANMYARMARSGAVIHYVSAGPWQLYPPLAEFLQREGFPGGIFYMRYFGFSKNLSALFEPSETIKKPFIEKLLKQFPEHRFVFFGDSGEGDPELYGECARMNPGRVAGIYIRNVTGETAENPRIARAFRGLPGGLWRLFKDVKEYEREIIRRAITRARWPAQ